MLGTRQPMKSIAASRGGAALPPKPAFGCLRRIANPRYLPHWRNGVCTKAKEVPTDQIDKLDQAKLDEMMKRFDWADKDMSGTICRTELRYLLESTDITSQCSSARFTQVGAKKNRSGVRCHSGCPVNHVCHLCLASGFKVDAQQPTFGLMSALPPIGLTFATRFAR
ncbi:hypothetical protein DUNSADRAFT_9532 [Dunaliella salina]|uniref:EF-hand domain-containing protein n=1 Tax=Dunaliella salina TaxID=3046 RepID=A0ABQ7GH85_DUNSA|nr:hypothetical protein DUNSADRAFT_9532 [Dunaliella salina]|eukprot:KAF5833968.1 hypothetical protein DUNSADRAFT_9532 [Dunaliella salina]